MKEKKDIGIFVLIVGAFGCLPMVLDSETAYFVYFLFMAFTYLALAQAWNLIAGYTGQISLGHHAFFGLGAYVMGIGWLQGITGYFDPFGFLFSGLAPAILAIMIGIPLLSKLRGDYFALGTLGLAEILRVIFIQGGAFTGGSAGLMLASTEYISMRPYYFMALFLALLATAVNFFIIRSRIGLALIAVRDDELAAAASGIHVLKYKVLAFAVGAFIAGLCGSLQGYYLFHVHPHNFFGLNWTLYPILMCILGGTGTIMGPVIGALFLTAIFEIAKIWLPELHPIFSGVLIIGAIMFLPDGLMRLTWNQLLLRRRRIHKPINKDAERRIQQ